MKYIKKNSDRFMRSIFWGLFILTTVCVSMGGCSKASAFTSIEQSEIKCEEDIMIQQSEVIDNNYFKISEQSIIKYLFLALIGLITWFIKQSMNQLKKQGNDIVDLKMNLLKVSDNIKLEINECRLSHMEKIE